MFLHFFKPLTEFLLILLILIVLPSLRKERQKRLYTGSSLKVVSYNFGNTFIVKR